MYYIYIIGYRVVSGVCFCACLESAPGHAFIIIYVVVAVVAVVVVVVVGIGRQPAPH